jgi:hypothetical protein
MDTKSSYPASIVKAVKFVKAVEKMPTLLPLKLRCIVLVAVGAVAGSKCCC